MKVVGFDESNKTHEYTFPKLGHYNKLRQKRQTKPISELLKIEVKNLRIQKYSQHESCEESSWEDNSRREFLHLKAQYISKTQKTD